MVVRQNDSGYNYAKKSQTIQWKCQIAADDFRNMPG